MGRYKLDYKGATIQDLLDQINDIVSEGETLKTYLESHFLGTSSTDTNIELATSDGYYKNVLGPSGAALTYISEADDTEYYTWYGATSITTQNDSGDSDDEVISGEILLPQGKSGTMALTSDLPFFFDDFIEGEDLDSRISEGERYYCTYGTENTGNAIQLKWTQSISKALYLKRITVYYTQSGDDIEYNFDYEFTKTMFSSTGEVELDGITWYLTTDAGYFGYDSDRGQQFGSSKKPATSIVLKSSEFKGHTITGVEVILAGGSNNDVVFKVIAGGDVIATQETIGTEATEYGWYAADGDFAAVELPEDSGIVFEEQFVEKVDDEFVVTNPEEERIYVDKASENFYIFDGSTLVTIGSNLELGTTEGTAYPGNYGYQNYQNVSNLLDWQTKVEEQLEDLPTISTATYQYAATALGGLQINGTTYRILPQGTVGNYYSLAVGVDSQATNTQTTAYGPNAKATGSYSCAYGSYASAAGAESIALGYSSSASTNGSTALGYDSTASSSYSTAVGCASSASSLSSTALGYASSASKTSSVALGHNSKASGTYSTALGTSSLASGDYATAVGCSSSASTPSSTALGFASSASTIYSTALGHASSASSAYSTALGDSSSASGDNSTALGCGSTASKASSIALGHNSKASSTYSIALGCSSIASGDYSIALGYNSSSSNKYSTALGYDSTASGSYSTAVGYNSVASGDYSVTLGAYTYAKWAYIASLYGYGNSTDTSKQLLIRYPSDILFANEAATSTTNDYTAFSSFTNGKTLQDYFDSFATQTWVQEQGYLTAHQDLSNYVDLTSEQTITGAKTFSGNFILNNDDTLNGDYITSEYAQTTFYFSASGQGQETIATREWVEAQDYLSNADFSNYATQTWVNENKTTLYQHIFTLGGKTWVVISSDAELYTTFLSGGDSSFDPDGYNVVNIKIADPVANKPGAFLGYEESSTTDTYDIWYFDMTTHANASINIALGATVASDSVIKL